MKRNLYGHPRAGNYWEEHVQNILTGDGFKPIPGWECVYHHPEKQLLVSVYVDDFKIGGNNKHTKPMIARLSKLIELDEAVPLHGDVYLGCKQEDIPTPEDLVRQKTGIYNSVFHDEKIDPDDNNQGGAAIPQHIKAWQYDMQGHVKQTVDRYCELAGVTTDTLKEVATPNLDDHMLQK